MGRQLAELDGRNVHKIAAAAEAPEEDRVLRVAAYCRVSTDDIDQKISIHMQIKHYTELIKSNPNWKYADCYVDDGFSGTNTSHRQGFQKLMLLGGGTPEEIADVLTELAIPTGGRRRDGTLNTHWTAKGVIGTMRNEKHCGDVLARKTYTPNYKDHKAKKNNGKKNKYFQPDHHEAIVSRATWNAALWRDISPCLARFFRLF